MYLLLYSVLRLEMLNKKEHPFLIESLCAILMILPQGKISNILKNRLEISKIIQVESSNKKTMAMGESKDGPKAFLTSTQIDKLLA